MGSNKRGAWLLQKHMMNIGAPEEYLEDMRSFLNLKGWRQHNDLLPNGWAWTVCPKGGRPKILWGTRASGSIHHQVWTQSRGKIKPGKIFYSWHTADLRLQGEWVHRIGGKNSNNIKAVEMFNSGIGPRTFPQSGGLDHTWPQSGYCPKGWKIRLKGF